MRRKVVHALGGRCCRCGFKDWRALQIDHRNGGGNRELARLSRHAFHMKVLADPTPYQLLCANCNWIKRYEEAESVGGRRRLTPVFPADCPSEQAR
jgi:hypothetical protein